MRIDLDTAAKFHALHAALAQFVENSEEAVEVDEASVEPDELRAAREMLEQLDAALAAQASPEGPACPHCSTPRRREGDYTPPTCGRSECQEAETRANAERARSRRRAKKAKPAKYTAQQRADLRAAYGNPLVRDLPW